jgi:sensor histidine kinase YesM
MLKTVLAKLRHLFSNQFLRWTLLFNTILTFIIFFLSQNLGYTWYYKLFYNFLAASCIGTSTGIALAVGSGMKLSSRIIKFVAISGMLILATWVGLFLFNLFRIGLMGLPYTLEEILKGVNFNSSLVLYLIFCSIFYLHFSLRNKWNEALKRIARMELAEEKLLRMKTKAELNALQAKVNPHFLFNTINSISRLIRVDPGKADEMLRQLADLLRYSLDSGNHEKIELQEEMNIIRKYLGIEKVRFGDRLNYSIDVDESLHRFKIPGMLLQPLVENSVRHGIAPKKAGGEIEIEITKNSRCCLMEIRDTGVGFDPDNVEKGFGLGGLEERLALYYGDNHRLNISTNQGVRVELHLPIPKK